MKRLLVGLMIIAGCAPAKRPYYFDRYNPKGAVDPLHSIEAPSAVDRTLEASTSGSPALFTPLTAETTETIPGPVLESPSAHQAATRVERKHIRRDARELLRSLKRDYKKGHPNALSAIEPDPSKNGFAVAGFVISLVGILFFAPLCILGLIFSAIGMRSEKRGLATAGLIIGIVGVAILVIAVLLLTSLSYGL